MMKRYLLYISLYLISLSCNVSRRDIKEDIPHADTFQTIQSSQEKTEELRPEIAFKGVVISEHDVLIYSRVPSQVESLNIREGSYVKKGQVLVRFDSCEADIKVKLALNQLDQADFQYKTILVGQGYDSENQDDIPENVKKAARVRSSMELCESQLENARLYQSYCTVCAPLGGVIADLNIHQHDFVVEGTPLFHIVDMENLSVEFHLLETDLQYFKQGTEIVVHPLSDDSNTYPAEVFSIGRRIDENGMVKVWARLRNIDNPIVGMSVLISLK